MGHHMGPSATPSWSVHLPTLPSPHMLPVTAPATVRSLPHHHHRGVLSRASNIQPLAELVCKGCVSESGMRQTEERIDLSRFLPSRIRLVDKGELKIH